MGDKEWADVTLEVAGQIVLKMIERSGPSPVSISVTNAREIGKVYQIIYKAVDGQESF